MAMLAGCALQKQSGFNRDMQNLTTHFNILFNAREILQQKQDSYASSFADNYNEILSVYQDTILQSQTPDKDLEAAISKGYNIINYKDQSKYIGDAYLVLGQANYLEGNFYNADEFLSYVIHNYPERKDLVRDARIWKTRALIYLNQLPQAKRVIDSAIQSINPKKKISADIYATKLQYDIAAEDYKDAEDMAKLALKYCHNQNRRLRWTFILAQIEELNNEQVNAAPNYDQISKSNALFEMAFNASLNLIRIEDNEKGVKIDRITKLLGLLKNPNNKEFKDQIYYQVAQLQMADKKVDEAVKYYNLSVRTSIKNQSQKGLSYLRLAEIYFKNKADYLKSKKYYDSTLTNLPINYPGYLAIKKTGSNLSYLAERLQVIAKEDTLQALARMDEKTRTVVIDKMVNDNTLQQKAAAAAAQINSTVTASRPGGFRTASGSQAKGGTFYFDNANALSQGYNDFKRVWGNRILEDNWRRSTRGAAEASNNTAASAQSADPDAPAESSKTGKSSATASSYRKYLVDALPLTPALLTASNLRVYNAYIDLGDFYRDILQDKKDAIEIFEKILSRFPQDSNKPAIYYNLYRLYSNIDPAKSDYYKDKLLKEFPATPFAKIIIDPEFARKLEGQDAEFTKAYNDLFDLYADKKYNEVIKKAPLLLKEYPGSKLSAQIFYLQIISQGHNEKVGPFADSLQQLIKIYPNDKLIVPLAKQHLAYISANQNEMLARNVVIADVDPRDIPFTLAQENKEKATYRKILKPYIFAAKPGERIVEKKKEEQVRKPAEAVKTAPKVDSVRAIAQVKAQKITPKTDTTKTIAQLVPDKPPVDTTKTIAQVTPPVGKPAETPPNIAPVDTVKTSQIVISSQADPDALKAKVVMPSIFSKGDSTNYYFVVNVTSGTTNLASSRFGIGQFTRANYAGNGIKHQLKVIGDHDQAIFVGLFPSLEKVKKFAHDIVPLLPDIMKVPKDKYSFFIITKENLDKLADQKTMDSYIDYYQNNY
ncbi:tetratricopeptide repeat protein [Mucilaginibacter sp.]|uniref:type IX secretion system periplasmic lipoprotein PorW/SprE n=1 Tax=Mucilaginibacter sp. TaxID=1882438 RepID=UPI002841FA24|nr:tetratricopeptide repeat protein [Mucilaginibacter sp.]MDR3693239.1 tetratricopeptide repeat protein [Mucilaginibacter sp.]